MANIAVLGHGVVGSGVLEVLTSHAASIAKRAKEEIHVKYILDLKEFRACRTATALRRISTSF